jgi:Xaa-Pro aminopeptidase
MNLQLENLISAEKKAAQLFEEIQLSGLIVPGKTEKILNKEIYDLAKRLFGVKKHWHKRIVRAGKNTLFPYRENPVDLTLKEDDILFFDFGPVFEEWEADFGRTYVIGNDQRKLKLKSDVELAWQECRNWYFKKPSMTGAELYNYCVALASQMGWSFGGSIAGHIIGKFPHEKLKLGQKENYVHPKNLTEMTAPGKTGETRTWILEIHFVDASEEIGGFYEQLLM